MPEIANTPNASTSRGHYARSGETRTRILEAAKLEAEESGFHHTSVTRIAARASVAAGVLNYHFGSKQELLRELMATLIDDFLARLAPPQPSDDFFTYEARLLKTYLEFLRANPAYVRLAEEIRLHHAELYREGTDAHAAHIAQRLQRGVEQGDIAEMSPAQLKTQSFLILGALTFLDRLIETNHPPTDDEIVDTYVSQLRSGVGGRTN